MFNPNSEENCKTTVYNIKAKKYNTHQYNDESFLTLTESAVQILVLEVEKHSKS